MFPVEPEQGRAGEEAPGSLDEIRNARLEAPDFAGANMEPATASDAEPPAQQGPPSAPAAASQPQAEQEPYKVGEKIRSLLDVALNSPPRTQDPAVLIAMRGVRIARRMGLLNMLAGVFPPLDDEDAWHEWLAIAVGVCLELTSDGFELDPDVCRQAGREVLSSAFGAEP